MDSEQFECLFSSDELFDFCKKFNEQVTKKDLEEPTAHFVQTVFFKFLMGIGYSETLLNTNQSEFCILEELGEHAGKILIYKHFWQLNI